LAAILDLYSRFIVGWAVSALNDRQLTIKALEMALKRRCPDVGLLHHSDQGCTYASEDYEAILDARGITCSISRRGNCYDDGVMESFFSTVKSELAVSVRVGPARSLLAGEIVPFTPWMSRDATPPLRETDGSDIQQQQQQQQ